MCTTAHERVDVVAFRKDYVSHWGTIKHRVVRGSGPEVEALLGKPYEYRFSPEEQAVLKVTLHDKPDGTQERPLLVRWQAASHQGPSPITFQIVEVFPLDATSMLHGWPQTLGRQPSPPPSVRSHGRALECARRHEKREHS